jgi:hypothetical protein
MKVVLWIGPVWPGIIANAVPSDWVVKTIDDHVAGGNGSEAYKNWALSLGSDPLSRLAPGARQIVVAGFSRAHGAIEVLLGRAAASRDERITALVALDSYYSSLGVTQPKPGFFAWCKLALERGLPVVFTTSSGHQATHQSAADSIKPLAQALNLQPTRVVVPNLPEPMQTFGNGSIVWFDYEGKVRHEDHALKLAQPLLATGIPFRAPIQRAAASPAQRFAQQQRFVPQTAPNTPPTTQTKVASTGPGLGLFVGLALVAGLGAAVYSLGRVRPKKTDASESNVVDAVTV